MVKPKVKYECTKCGSTYETKEDAENCCLTYSELSKIRDEVHKEIYLPLKNLYNKERQFDLRVKAIPQLFLRVVFEIPEIEFYVGESLQGLTKNDLYCYVYNNYKGSEDRYEYVKSFLEFVTGSPYTEELFNDLFGHLCLENKLQTMEELCGKKEVKKVLSYVEEADKVLRSISEKYLNGGTVYKAMVETFLYEDPEYVLTLDEVKLRGFVQYYRKPLEI